MPTLDKCPKCKKRDRRKGVLVPARKNTWECAYCGQQFVEREGKFIKVEDQRDEHIPARHVGTIHQLHGEGGGGKRRGDLSQLEGAEEKDD